MTKFLHEKSFRADHDLPMMFIEFYFLEVRDELHKVSGRVREKFLGFICLPHP